MRYLTLKGFLANYLSYVSEKGDRSVTKLSKELFGGNTKLKEPLMIYAMLTQKKESLQKLLTKNPLLAKEFLQHFSNLYFEKNIEEALSEKPSSLPKQYTDLYERFLKARNKIKTEDKTKLLLRSYIEMYKKQYGITNYRIYTDLKLNGGNFNDFMKNGNMDKLSLEDVKWTVEYLKTYKKKKKI